MFLHKKKIPPQKTNFLLSKNCVYLNILGLICILLISYLYTESSQKAIQKSGSPIFSGTETGIQKPLSSTEHICIQVEGSSMQGILDSGEYIWARKIHDANTEIFRGDIVIVHQAGYTNNLIKEVRGIPGDALSIHDLETEGMPYFTGSAIAGSFFIEINNTPIFLHDRTLLIYQPGKKALFSLYSGKLGTNSYLIFGTQQGGTHDSSRYGPISGDAIIGKMEEHGRNDDFCKNKKL